MIPYEEARELAPVIFGATVYLVMTLCNSTRNLLTKVMRDRKRN